MILYNTLMGVSAGLALILVPLLARKLHRRQQIAPEGWSLTLGVLGTILTFLGGLMAVTWPLHVNPPINIAFAEPTVVLGLLLVAASFFLWKQRETITDLASSNKQVADQADAQLRRILEPVSWLIFVLGMVMFACTVAILRFNLVGSAPAAEPITGLLHDYPIIENTFFGVLYGLVALGTLLTPLALRHPTGAAARIAGTALVTAGVIFVLFSVMNYYTHIGMLVNLTQGKNFEF
jgi:uncharacterized membrane protein